MVMGPSLRLSQYQPCWPSKGATSEPLRPVSCRQLSGILCLCQAGIGKGDHVDAFDQMFRARLRIRVVIADYQHHQQRGFKRCALLGSNGTGVFSLRAHARDSAA